MHKVLLGSAIILAILLSSPGKSIAQTINLSGNSLNTDQSRLLVKFNRLNRSKLSKFCEENLVSKDRILPGFEVLNIGKGKKRERILSRLKSELLSEIQFAELEKVLPPDFIPNDANYNNQWFHPKIDDEEAWDTTFGSSGIIIAILDTGVDSTHPDLAANIVPGWNIANNNSDTSDVYGHGTSVAGNAAMVGNNSIGGAGVCPGCKIMPIRISGPNGWATSSDAALGVIWAADHGARVANLSYAFAGTGMADYMGDVMMAKGGILTISAGNYNTNVTSPSSAKYLTVGSVNSNDQRSSFSNYGAFLSLMAPGENMYLTLNGGGYGGCAGTSFSAPTVAGVAGLVLSANANLTALEVMNIIKSSADDLGAPGRDDEFGWGRVNAHSAIIMATSSGSPTATPTSTPTSTSTPTYTPTSVPTSTPTPLNTPTATATPTPVSTLTGTPTPIVTGTPTQIATGTPTPESPIDPELSLSISPSSIRQGGRFVISLEGNDEPLNASIFLGRRKCGETMLIKSNTLGKLALKTPASKLTAVLDDGTQSTVSIKKRKLLRGVRIGQSCKTLMSSLKRFN